MLFDGQLITNLSGRLGTNVFARCRRQNYVRSLGPPPNPLHSDEQETCRVAMADLFGEWQALTDPERESWNTYSLRTLRPGRTGQLRSIGAWPEYTRANFIRRQATIAGTSTLTSTATPPPEASAPFPWPRPSATNAAADDNLIITFEDTADWFSESENGIVVWVSPFKPATVNFYKSPMTILTTLGAQTGGSPQSIRLHADPASEAGQHLFVRYRLTLANGLLSLPYEEMIVVS